MSKKIKVEKNSVQETLVLPLFGKAWAVRNYPDIFKDHDVSYHNLVCPLAIFARKYGYEAYMPYLCNLDYVNFGLLGAPLYREHRGRLWIC